MSADPKKAQREKFLSDYFAEPEKYANFDQAKIKRIADQFEKEEGVSAYVAFHPAGSPDNPPAWMGGAASPQKAPAAAPAPAPATAPEKKESDALKASREALAIAKGGKGKPPKMEQPEPGFARGRGLNAPADPRMSQRETFGTVVSNLFGLVPTLQGVGAHVASSFDQTRRLPSGEGQMMQAPTEREFAGTYAKAGVESFKSAREKVDRKQMVAGLSNPGTALAADLVRTIPEQMLLTEGGMAMRALLAPGAARAVARVAPKAGAAIENYALRSADPTARGVLRAFPGARAAGQREAVEEALNIGKMPFGERAHAMGKIGARYAGTEGAIRGGAESREDTPEGFARDVLQGGVGGTVFGYLGGAGAEATAGTMARKLAAPLFRQGLDKRSSDLNIGAIERMNGGLTTRLTRDKGIYPGKDLERYIYSAKHERGDITPEQLLAEDATSLFGKRAAHTIDQGVNAIPTLKRLYYETPENIRSSEPFKALYSKFAGLYGEESRKALGNPRVVKRILDRVLEDVHRVVVKGGRGRRGQVGEVGEARLQALRPGGEPGRQAGEFPALPATQAGGRSPTEGPERPLRMEMFPLAPTRQEAPLSVTRPNAAREGATLQRGAAAAEQRGAATRVQGMGAEAPGYEKTVPGANITNVEPFPPETTNTQVPFKTDIERAAAASDRELAKMPKTKVFERPGARTKVYKPTGPRVDVVSEKRVLEGDAKKLDEFIEPLTDMAGDLDKKASSTRAKVVRAVLRAAQKTRHEFYPSHPGAKRMPYSYNDEAITEGIKNRMNNLRSALGLSEKQGAKVDLDPQSPEFDALYQRLLSYRSGPGSRRSDEAFEKLTTGDPLNLSDIRELDNAVDYMLDSPQGEKLLKLIEGNRVYQKAIGKATDEARGRIAAHPFQSGPLPTSATLLSGPGVLKTMRLRGAGLQNIGQGPAKFGGIAARKAFSAREIVRQALLGDTRKEEK